MIVGLEEVESKVEPNELKSVVEDSIGVKILIKLELIVELLLVEVEVEEVNVTGKVITRSIRILVK
jgi:hypothetical protein